MKYKTQKNSLGFALILATFSALGPFTVDMYLASLPQIAVFWNKCNCRSSEFNH